MNKSIENLLKEIYKMYQDPEYAHDAEMEEIGKMSWEEFCEFEEDAWDCEKSLGTNFKSYEEYLKWVMENFGDWT